MVRAGLSEVYGSWKTTWMSLASARRSLAGQVGDVPPSKRIVPPVTGARPSTARPSVVLPEPDSPTSPTVSPARMSRRHAVEDLERRASRSPRPGSRRRGRRTSSSGSVTADRCRLRMRCRSCVRAVRVRGRPRGSRRAAPRVYSCRGRRRSPGDRAGLDDPAAPHHRDPVAEVGDDAEVVGDEQDRHAALAPAGRAAGRASRPGR